MKFSIITPIYNGSENLAETINSVLNQTYPHFEHILVDDASPHSSDEVIHGFKDKRIIYIKNSENRGANFARNTGIHAASGDVIAFLDQDDLFHPEKLEVHASLLSSNPEVGLTYNGRFEFNDSKKNIRNIWQPPPNLGLSDIVISTHLISPSDMVVRKGWLTNIGLLNEIYPVIGSEMIWLGQLIFNGCKFASTERILNYRRHYSGRIFSHLAERCQSELDSRDVIFSDPCCPQEVREKRKVSFANNYLVFANLAFTQNETALGHKFLKESTNLNPTFLTGNPPVLVTSLALASLIDENEAPESFVKRIFLQLPEELEWLIQYIDWAIAYRYLILGMRNLVYGQHEFGKKEILRAKESGISFDDNNLRILTQMILDNRIAYGSERAERLLEDVCSDLEEIGERNTASGLRAEVLLNLAFKHYRSRKYRMVPGEVFKVISNRPSFMVNRGVISILLRSLIDMFRQNLNRST
jgi:glycosyltransferase involved in cell wall biosynthesis